MSDKNQNAEIQIARQFMAAIPHARDLGMELTELEGGVATITMPYDDRRPRNGHSTWRCGYRADGQGLRGGCDVPPLKPWRNRYN